MSTDTDTESDPAPSLPDRTSRRSRWAQLVALLGIGLVGAGGWLVADETGLIAAAVIALCWYLLSSLYAVAIGHAMVLLLTTETLPPELLIAEVGLGVVLIAPAVDTDGPAAFIGSFLGGLGALLALGVATYWWSNRLWIAAAVLLGALAVAGYGLYRYELVSLGLVESDPT